MSKAGFDRAARLGPAMRKLRLTPSTPNYEFLFICPAKFTPKYKERSDNWAVGEFFRANDDCKLLVTSVGRINGDPMNSNICKLFRDEGRYDSDGTRRIWIREEFCLRGTERWHEDSNTERTGWYIVDVDRVDDSTPPPNSQSWRKSSTQ